MLQPTRQKYRKQHKGRNRGLALTGNKVSFGDFGLKATGRGRITARQIEAARRVMTRHIKRGGRIWIRIFPDVPVSKKPAEVRMGKGKGSNEFWACRVKPGRIMFEVDGVNVNEARKAKYEKKLMPRALFIPVNMLPYMRFQQMALLNGKYSIRQL